jgi:hypothetical protein
MRTGRKHKTREVSAGIPQGYIFYVSMERSRMKLLNTEMGLQHTVLQTEEDSSDYKGWLVLENGP